MKFTRKVLKDGRVAVRWREPLPGGGYRRPQRICADVSEAELLEAELRLEARDGTLVLRDARKRPLRDIAAEWAKVHVAHVEPSTMEGYVKLYDLHIEPYLGHLLAEDFETPAPVEEWNATLSRRRLGPQGGWIDKPVGAATRSRALAVLSSILSFAERRRYINRHAVRLMAKSARPRPSRLREIEALSVETVEVARRWFLEEFRPRQDSDRYKYAAMVSLLAYTGMRPGELLALTRRDVRERTITVRATVAHGSREQRTKTRAKRARHPRMIAAVREDMDQWLECWDGRETDLLFADSVGRPWSKSAWDRWRKTSFRNAMVAAGVEVGARPYDLRHTCVSLRFMQGDSVIEVADDLGHSPAVCLSTYAHVVAEYRDLQPADRRTMEELVQATRSRGGGREVDAMPAEHMPTATVPPGGAEATIDSTSSLPERDSSVWGLMHGEQHGSDHRHHAHQQTPSFGLKYQSQR
ncbi:MAG: site-specific integrase [Thermoleophilia bacterium]|nr:site-specific integrase [Thermoleophilia bacterium]